jgi:hypothetical protein
MDSGYLVSGITESRKTRAGGQVRRVASGLIEGTCNSLVNDRMEQSGMRWSIDGAEAMLQQRAVKKNGDWNDFWAYRIDCERDRALSSHLPKSRLTVLSFGTHSSVLTHNAIGLQTHGQGLPRFADQLFAGLIQVAASRSTRSHTATPPDRRQPPRNC